EHHVARTLQLLVAPLRNPKSRLIFCQLVSTRLFAREPLDRHSSLENPSSSPRCLPANQDSLKISAVGEKSMKFWLMTLAISIAWVALVLAGMVLHAKGEDSLLEQKYAQIAGCGFVVIWSFALLLRIGRKPSNPK